MRQLSHGLNARKAFSMRAGAIAAALCSIATLSPPALAHFGDCVSYNNVPTRHMAMSPLHGSSAHRAGMLDQTWVYERPSRHITCGGSNGGHHRGGHRGANNCRNYNFGPIAPAYAPVYWDDYYHEPAPYGYGYGYDDGYVEPQSYETYPAVITRRNPRIEQQMRDGTYPEPQPIEMVLLTPPREATQTAVMEHVTLPDGRVKTIITSIPKDQAPPAPEPQAQSAHLVSTSTSAPE
jgi:hypothetical protein